MIRPFEQIFSYFWPAFFLQMQYASILSDGLEILIACKRHIFGTILFLKTHYYEDQKKTQLTVKSVYTTMTLPYINVGWGGGRERQ